MPAHSADEQLLARALDLARQGIGLASPNPYVGAVIADAQGDIVGEGVYTYAGLRHAEILALQAAGERARGGTLYINLEPHAHQGRTPPCTDALIAAGIRRVVASMADPNPKVSGHGFDQLRAAGVQVEVGGLEDQARRLNEGFARCIRSGIPLVTLKSALTLDGKIAPPPGVRQEQSTNEFAGTWITGEAARAHVHELRHQHDAMLAGIGTILADNPLLTDRSGHPRRRPLLRVILDSRLRLPLESRLAQSANNDVLIFSTRADDRKLNRLEQLGIRAEIVSAVPPHGWPDLAAVLRRLGEMEITNLLIEGGSTVNGVALASGVVDKIFLYYAPKVLGPNAVPFLSGGLSGQFASGITGVRLHNFGGDFAVEGYLRDPYID
jgi:diaminohydroxyphosphoribosylaminopyrimidine deaminase/5-amino-6-(5-phosphoribosylamino)uracil reductase